MMRRKLPLGKYARFYRYLLVLWKEEFLVLSLGSLSVLLALVNPYLAKLIIDKAYGNRDLKLFIFLVGAAGAVFFLNAVIVGFNAYLNRRVKMRLSFSLNRDVFKKLQALPYGFFQNTSTGEHLYKINYDIQQVTQLISETLPRFIYLIPRVILILAVVFYLNRRIAVFILVSIPFLYMLPYYFKGRLKKIFGRQVEASEAVFRRMQETLSHMHLIKAMGKEKREIRYFIRGLKNYIRLALRGARTEVTVSFWIGLFNRLVLGLVIFYGGYNVIKGRISLGALSAIAIYLAQLAEQQNLFVQFSQQFLLGAVSCERLERILGYLPSSGLKLRDKEFVFSQGEVRFEKVSFSYSPPEPFSSKAGSLEVPVEEKGRPVLDNLSFFIPPGSCVGIVGPSGCGKTTIVSLILRLYRPQGGMILIDGQDIADIKSKSLHGQIGIALQEPFLWDDTIENNIGYGREDALPWEIKEAARIACIDGFINSLPLGYKTVIGENACRISEGQKQRLVVARAVLKKPRLLILDEAFSSLDSETEEIAVDNIRRAFWGSTVIIVSHRLSTVKSMDRVYFLLGPSLMASGRHEDLLEEVPGYRHLFANQLDKETASPYPPKA